MIVAPELAALRSDDAPPRPAQRELGDMLARWRTQPQVAAVLAELPRFAAGAALADCPALAALFRPEALRALAFAQDLAGVISDALMQWPLGHVPLRHFTDGTHSTLLIERCGAATLALVGIDGAGLEDRPPPTTASFTPVETWECAIGGRAEIETVRLVGDGPGIRLARRADMVGPGSVAYRDGRIQTRFVTRAEGTFVALRLQRRCGGGALAREFDLATGALVHQAAGEPGESRLEMAMALLGRMGRGDAAPHMAAIARSRRSAPLRWQALRESLALDSAQGFAALCTVAGDPADPLAAPAGALRAQLLEAYPQLQEIAACRV
jgi:hypothetical protein